MFLFSLYIIISATFVRPTSTAYIALQVATSNGQRHIRQLSQALSFVFFILLRFCFSFVFVFFCLFVLFL